MFKIMGKFLKSITNPPIMVPLQPIKAPTDVKDEDFEVEETIGGDYLFTYTCHKIGFEFYDIPQPIFVLNEKELKKLNNRIRRALKI